MFFGSADGFAEALGAALGDALGAALAEALGAALGALEVASFEGLTDALGEVVAVLPPHENRVNIRRAARNIEITFFI